MAPKKTFQIKNIQKHFSCFLDDFFFKTACNFLAVTFAMYI